MSKSCCGASPQTMILACSGGSNVGQLTNQAAVELHREGHGKMFCLAGLGGGIAGLVKAAREAQEVVVLDGCPLGCARAIVEQVGIRAGRHVQVTDLGIAKVKDAQFLLRPEEVERVKQAARG